jgi:hypothetical protein
VVPFHRDEVHHDWIDLPLPPRRNANWQLEEVRAPRVSIDPLRLPQQNVN